MEANCLSEIDWVDSVPNPVPFSIPQQANYFDAVLATRDDPARIKRDIVDISPEDVLGRAFQYPFQRSILLRRWLSFNFFLAFVKKSRDVPNVDGGTRHKTSDHSIADAYPIHGKGLIDDPRLIATESIPFR